MRPPGPAGSVGVQVFDCWQTQSQDSPRLEGDYHRAVEVHGCDVTLMLVGVLGGFGPELVGLVKRLTEERANRMTRSEYDQTTWAARSWRSFNVQKISVAVQRAAALEVAYALGLSTAGDARPGA